MNAYDSTRMLDLLAPLGYRPVDKPDSAYLIILNTCHIREKASDKVYSELGRLRQIKRERSANGDQLIIGVAGCVAQAEGAEIIRRAPYVDMVFGPQTYHRLPEMVMRAQRSTETGQRYLKSPLAAPRTRTPGRGSTQVPTTRSLGSTRPTS